MEKNYPLVFKFLCEEVFKDKDICRIEFVRPFTKRKLLIADTNGNKTSAYIDEINGWCLGWELCHDGITKITHQLDLDNISRSERFLNSLN